MQSASDKVPLGSIFSLTLPGTRTAFCGRVKIFSRRVSGDIHLRSRPSTVMLPRDVWRILDSADSMELLPLRNLYQYPHLAFSTFKKSYLPVRPQIPIFRPGSTSNVISSRTSIAPALLVCQYSRITKLWMTPTHKKHKHFETKPFLPMANSAVVQ